MSALPMHGINRPLGLRNGLQNIAYGWFAGPAQFRMIEPPLGINATPVPPQPLGAPAPIVSEAAAEFPCVVTPPGFVEESMDTLSTFHELTVNTPPEPIMKPHLTWKAALTYAVMS